MELTRLTAEDPALLDECIRFHHEVSRFDCPADPPQSRQMLERSLTTADPEMDLRWHIATVDGKIAGYTLAAFPLQANPHMMFAHGTVRPDLRRRGLGTALLDLVTGLGKEAGRDTQMVSAKTTVPDGPHYSDSGELFLEAKGFARALGSVERRIDLAAIDLAQEEELLQGCLVRAEGYEVLSWIGATPDEHAEGVARLRSRGSTDVPHGDLEFEAQTWTAERILAADAAVVDRGVTMVGTAVRHVESGELVGRSLVAINPGVPEFAYQWITLVEPDHRGHGLGTLLKIANHRQLRRELSAVRYIDTVNADENAAMAAVNQRMGFRPLSRTIDFQRKF